MYDWECKGQQWILNWYENQTDQKFAISLNRPNVWILNILNSIQVHTRDQDGMISHRSCSVNSKASLMNIHLFSLVSPLIWMSTYSKVSLLGVDSPWGDCTFIPSDWGVIVVYLCYFAPFEDFSL